MSNQVYSNGVQVGGPTPAALYVGTAQVYDSSVSINGPIAGSRDIIIVSQGRAKTLIIVKFSGPAAAASTSWSSFTTLPPAFWPTHKQTFVVPITIDGVTVPGYLIMFTTGFFSILTSVAPTIGLISGWEDITVAYI